MNEFEAKQLIVATVEETLTKIGIDHEDPIEMQKDFQHLREWREAATAMKKKGMITAVGVIVTGVLAAIWLAIREYLP